MSRRARKPRLVTIGSRQIRATGLEKEFWSDFYHNAMTIRWITFLGMTAALFVLINILFAVLYTFGTAPVSDAHDVLQYFFFSIETLATVGYGDMHPQTGYGHAVASVETFIGLFLTAVLTGLVFARFSRPRARFTFAKVMVVTSHDGVPSISVRLANARLSLVSDASARLWMMRTRLNAEGVRFRGFEELRLERADNPFFALSWTLFHKIDGSSPLHGLTSEHLASAEAFFLVTVTGHDDSAAQTIYARQNYELEHVRWQHRYKDILRTEPDGGTHLDYLLLHETEPLEAQPASASNPS